MPMGEAEAHPCMHMVGSAGKVGLHIVRELAKGNADKAGLPVWVRDRCMCTATTGNCIHNCMGRGSGNWSSRPLPPETG